MSNPKLVIYLELRLNKFKDILNMGYKNDELRLRNNIIIRKLFVEIICILCLSKKNHIFQEIKIKKEDFILTNIKDKVKATTTDFIQPFFKEKDPKYLLVEFNEFIYNLHNKNCIDACYWFEYILNYEIILKKNKEKCCCERRPYSNIEPKYQTDIIWIFWEIFFNIFSFFIKEDEHEEKPEKPETHENIVTQKIIKSCFNLFCIKYSFNLKYKRKYIIYFVITLLCSNVNYNNDIVIENKDYIAFLLSKIDAIYCQVKNNEISPNTDYLFSSLQNNKSSKNLEKTISNLEKMNKMQQDFIPREK
jgi:hypothetical protein